MGHYVDHWVAGLLLPLAIWVLISGVDDLLVDCAASLAYLARRSGRRDGEECEPGEAELDAAPKLRMAIFVALWQEHRVIQKMLDNNVQTLRYPLVDFFVGVY